ncbi:MAG: energy-coupling factor ABC transporter ATP-binding protein [Omnitrophica WOR_2 bacterium GWF2_43_52]|nr:MAG: energy-coupling factor ABC transporter ATP-binding protein [Omnitrophica WOR_2 bacterium GWC2_44_8]OGX22387.1 MAG: energy-coupling factor ABC transporter ATP-binding protein [Omnitrophica WOR_2 bacterium GWF2_43_52]OGX57870.1 MAG: energy-coupling factor ABC transporter ATP-binding protein [Omnitrophica WOR_2 bacterium RIFOXYC2_FULL_43_9]HAH20803.1 energy-coupling factor ABC transporter ATP-binding protein [Candidatus Omnitrophota bacterium]HBG64471.1 energy-coupling factor ABC transport
MNLQEKKLIETEALGFNYPDGVNALDGINIHIKKGEFVGILGANGSGKTTLLRLLNGLLKPTKGKVYLEQKDVKAINRDTLFSKVCTCFQNPDHQLFSPTVGLDIAFGPANLGLPKDVVRKRVEDALLDVGMSEYFNRTINSLSYGQKKRICLAGVLVMRPEVILLDEPTSSLDPMGVNAIMHLLKDLNKQKGVTMVMSTHSIDLVPIFIDRVIVLHKGRIISEGSPQEVFSDSKKLNDAQLRLPRIGELFDILKKEDGLNMDNLPLTVGEARQELKSLLSL